MPGFDVVPALVLFVGEMMPLAMIILLFNRSATWLVTVDAYVA